MADVFSPQKRSEFMRQVKTSGTKPEGLVRKYLFQQGFRYRKNVATLPGKPDMVLKKYSTVVFVNGCFWHAHENCKYFIVPKTRTEWWLKKLQGNAQRDERNKRLLENMGWHVYVVWECELKQHFEDTMQELVLVLRKNEEL